MALGCVRTVLFDKTGTLTEGKFKLKHLETVGKSKTREEVLRLLATMEAPSSHPLAATLVDAAKNEGVKMSDANGRSLVLDDHTILRGEGVTDHYAHGIILQRVRVMANVTIVSLA